MLRLPHHALRATMNELLAVIERPEEVARRVLEEIKRAGKSEASVAREAGLPNGAITKIKQGIRKIDAIDLLSIARVLQVDVGVFFVEPERLALDDTEARTLAALRDVRPDLRATVEAMIRALPKDKT